MPENPATPGTTFHSLTARDGLVLRWAQRQGAKPARGLVLLLHGRTEFIEKYHPVIDRLAQERYSVVTLDWRGQGRSGRMTDNPRKGHIDRFGQYLDDLALFIEKTVAIDSPQPRILLSHSMGGNIALRYLMEFPHCWDAAVFVSPMWELPFPYALSPLLRTASWAPMMMGLCKTFAPGLQYAGYHQLFDGNRLTGDRARYHEIRALLEKDPALDVGGPTIGWIHAALHSVARMRRELRRRAPSLPILVISSRGDRVVSPAAHRHIARRLPNAQLVEIIGAEHELLQEREETRARCMDEILSFIGRVAGKNGGAAAV